VIEITDRTNRGQNKKGHLENQRRGQKVKSERITKAQKEGKNKGERTLIIREERRKEEEEGKIIKK
jgi:hypothetical protein